MKNGLFVRVVLGVAIAGVAAPVVLWSRDETRETAPEYETRPKADVSYD